MYNLVLTEFRRDKYLTKKFYWASLRYAILSILIGWKMSVSNQIAWKKRSIEFTQ